MPETLSGELAAWRDRGRRLPVFGQEVFVLAEGEGAEPLLVLHGFPTCSLDFARALPFLAARRRVVLHDHPGFGLSDKPERYSYSLLEQAEFALGVWRELGISRGHLVAHDYGTSVASEILARRERGLVPVELLSLTLSNGSVLLELAHLRLAQRILRSPTLGPLFARVAGRAVFKRQMRRIVGDPGSVTEAELDLLWEALERAGGRARLPRISSYQEERLRFRDRWVGALSRLDLPAHVLWGRRDPIAVAAIAERLAATIPRARLTWLEQLGHYPMLEDPQRWSEGVLGFVGERA